MAFVGVMVGSVMTVTMTQIVIDDIAIYGKKVDVLENSYEYKVAFL